MSAQDQVIVMAPPQGGMPQWLKILIAVAVVGLIIYVYQNKDVIFAPKPPVPSVPGAGSSSPGMPPSPAVDPLPSPAVDPIPLPAPAPARPTEMTDCGYGDRPRGWYDVRGRGYKNDFCRHVGDYPGWWHCSVQGENNIATPGVFTYDPNAPFDPYVGNLQGWHCP